MTTERGEASMVKKHARCGTLSSTAEDPLKLAGSGRTAGEKYAKNRASKSQ